MKKNNSIAIRLTNISKRYTIHHENLSAQAGPTLVEKLVRRDEAFAGERVGIIGSSGI